MQRVNAPRAVLGAIRAGDESRVEPTCSLHSYLHSTIVMANRHYATDLISDEVHGIKIPYANHVCANPPH